MKKIYGPYTAKDGRQRLVISLAPGKTTTISYPKYLMQQRLGKKLSPKEVVHHKDENPLNNEPSNLEIKTKSSHASGHVIPAEKITFLCTWCGKEATKLARDIRGNKKKGRAGPFCGRRCAGKWSMAG